MKRKLKGKGGPGRGQGRKPGSTKPESRSALSKAYALTIADLLEEAERAGRWRCYKWAHTEAVNAAYKIAYHQDHPDAKADFDSYRNTQKALRKFGKRNSRLPQHPQDFMVAALEESFKVIVETLHENGDLKCEPAEALGVLRRHWPALYRRKR